MFEISDMNKSGDLNKAKSIVGKFINGVGVRIKHD